MNYSKDQEFEGFKYAWKKPLTFIPMIISITFLILGLVFHNAAGMIGLLAGGVVSQYFFKKYKKHYLEEHAAEL